MEPLIERLLQILGYLNSPGWVDASQFSEVKGPRAALRQASASMNVLGAYGTWQFGVGTNAAKRFAPLLYVARAESREEAKRIHSQVWSQGAVPLLLILTPDWIYASVGFGFSHDDWDAHIEGIPTLSALDQELPDPLRRLQARRLSSALAWRDFQLNPEGRVDRRLLSTLKSLATTVSKQSGAEMRAVNALLGRFLYFYMLRDRGLIDDKWLVEKGAKNVFDERSDRLTGELVWSVFDSIDRLLNGTIFPLSPSERAQFSDFDYRLLRDCIKLGDTIVADGGVQLSFLDFALSSLQTETLSAIYEQFLETEDPFGKRAQGVFYTPPFLVDFVLDRLEDEQPLGTDKRVMDCTAGSGVFLVGAYRRIIESELPAFKASLGAETLREILLNCIFGVEKSESAHSVAAFSLYLTMLDYVDADEISACLSGAASEPLFPPLAKTNLIKGDVFLVKAPGAHVRKFDAVVGNPPWQNAAAITSESEQLAGRYPMSVDSAEAAEYTLWWALENLLERGGVAALVMPAKSLLGPSANRFPTALTKEVDLIGLANFSHLRYVLFSGARQPACLLMCRNQRPSSASRMWVYSPTRAHLLGPAKGEPWLMTLDRSRIEHVRQRAIARNVERDAWFGLMMLRAVDRHIREYLEDSVEIGKLKTLGALLDSAGAELRKGGSPQQTGLPPYLLFGADKTKPNDFRNAPGVRSVRAVQQPQKQLLERSEVRPGANWLTQVQPNFKRRFSGDCLLVPRSMVDLAYAEQPLAFNSSLHAIFFSADQKLGPGARRKFLQAIGVFLESSVGRYLSAITGRLWMVDRSRIEKHDLLSLPVPFSGIDDPLVDEILQGDDLRRTQLICDAFELHGVLREAVEEYIEFRRKFEDGQVPTEFAGAPTERDMNAYQSALAFALRPAAHKASPLQVGQSTDAAGWLRVSVQLKPSHHGDIVDALLPRDVGDGISIEVIDAGARIAVSKPAERFRWTRESAFSDGAGVLEALMNSR